jgi:hypothetical protein
MSNARGVSLIEVLVLLVVIGLAVLYLLVMLPQGREQARLLGCSKNLFQIGVALALYDQSHDQLPLVTDLPLADDGAGQLFPGPLRALLETLELPDLTELNDVHAQPKRQPGTVPAEIRIPGFVCASDPNATGGLFPAPVSYRATTGDTPNGDDGAFAIGRVIRLQAIENADGLSYTAAFSERLVGDGQAGSTAASNFRVVPAPIDAGGPPPDPDTGAWRGDAGSSWYWSDYRHTLYNHALRPSVTGSCVAADGKSALMGASSGHVRGLNVLLLDGSVTLMRREIDQKIWQEFARINGR